MVKTSGTMSGGGDVENESCMLEVRGESTASEGNRSEMRRER